MGGLKYTHFHKLGVLVKQYAKYLSFFNDFFLIYHNAFDGMQICTLEFLLFIEDVHWQVNFFPFEGEISPILN